MKYSFITQNKDTYSARLQCQVLGVNRQCYYRYRRYIENNPVTPEHQEMLRLVKKKALESDHNYGSRRMKKAMNDLDFLISRSKARKLMREAGIEVCHRLNRGGNREANNGLLLW